MGVVVEPGDLTMLVTSSAELRRVHEQVIMANFPPEERGTDDDLVAKVDAGELWVYGVASGSDWGAAAVYERFERDTRILLLSWLAVAGSGRSGGLGGRLLHASLDDLYRRGLADLVLAEIELPDKPPHPVYGDPRSRTRFYARHGATLLPVRHRQPSMAEGLPEVPLLLIALPGPLGEPVREIDAARLRAFLAAYRCAPPGDPGWAETLRDLVPATVRTTDLA